MANPEEAQEVRHPNAGQGRLANFHIQGLFGSSEEITIGFPSPPAQTATPSILILSGRNGTGKTTILRMIDGMLRLDFDEFRRIPFARASLSLSTGETVGIESNADNTQFPLIATFGDHRVELAKDRQSDNYSAEQKFKIDAFREDALPILQTVNFVLLRVDRAPKLTSRRRRILVDAITGEPIKDQAVPTLAEQVRNFLRDAQVDHRRFFRAEELDLLPRILERLKTGRKPTSAKQLLKRVRIIQEQFPKMKRFGLQTDDAELTSLANVLGNSEYQAARHISLIETYVEMQEGIQRSRQLIANRLLEFEQITDEFFIGKQVRIDTRNGLTIHARDNLLRDSDLSSGEYHFLYMMVSALLCQQLGSIIAIDEPELSLHISWQRKLVRALARCAAGASPLFLFATHSLAIQAEHADKVLKLSPID